LVGHKFGIVLLFSRNEGTTWNHKQNNTF